MGQRYCTLNCIQCLRKGVKVWHIPTHQQITFVERSPDAPRADLYKCRLIWRDDSTLIIGWDDCVTTVSLKTDPTNRNTPHGEIEQLYSYPA
jgi:hypothetical protein